MSVFERMSRVMDASKRLRRLIRVIDVLQSGQILNSQQLAERCRVSRRTIFRDLALLQDSGLSIHYDEQRQGYFMPWRLSIGPAPLTLPEALALQLVCQAARDASSGIPFQELAVEAAEKIRATLPPKIQQTLASLGDSLEIRLDPHNPLVQSEEHYRLTLRAVLERRQVRIEYDSASEQKRISTAISPYRLLFSRRSWYVIGRSSVHRSVRTFNIGRIASARLLDSTYAIPPRFRLDKYLGDAWHLIREPKARARIQARFLPLVARNVAEIRWHRTQQVSWNDDGSITFTATVEGLTEVRWWLLGYGDQVIVESPPELRAQMAQIATRVLEAHRDES